MIWKMTNLAFLGADLRLLQGWVGVAPPSNSTSFTFLGLSSKQAPELKVETYLSHNLWKGAMDKANLTMSKSFRGKNDDSDQSTFAHRLGLRLSVQKMQILQTSRRQSPNSASLEKKWSTPRSRLERSGLSWKIIGIYIIMGCKYLSARMEKVFTFRCSHHM